MMCGIGVVVVYRRSPASDVMPLPPPALSIAPSLLQHRGPDVQAETVVNRVLVACEPDSAHRSSERAHSDRANGSDREVGYRADCNTSGERGVLDVDGVEPAPAKAAGAEEGRDARRKQREHRVDDRPLLELGGRRDAVEARPVHPRPR